MGSGGAESKVVVWSQLDSLSQTVSDLTAAGLWGETLGAPLKGQEGSWAWQWLESVTQLSVWSPTGGPCNEGVRWPVSA